MAASFSLTSGSYQGRYLKLSCTQTKDIANNKSTINWTLTSAGGESNYYTTGPTKVYINGTEVYSKGRTDWSAKTFPAAKGSVSGSLTVSHNNDGNKSISVSFSTAIYTATVSTYSGTWALDSNPRQANITGAPNFNDEQNPTITYSNPAGNAVDKLQACISLTGAKDDIVYRNISKTGSSYTFNLTEAERNVLRQATTGANSRTVKFYVQTTIGGNTYQSILNKTLTIVNAKPTLYPIIEDTNSVTAALTGNTSKMVKYFSSPEVATGSAAYKYASITNNSISNGSNYTTKASDVFHNIENAIFYFWAKDSRGNEIQQEINKINENNWIDYVKITCNPSPTNPTTDGKMSLNIKGNYWNGNFGAVANYLTLQYRMGIVGQSFGDWITVDAELDGNTYNASIPIEGLNYQTTYMFEVRALDKLETTPVKYLEVQTTPVFDWGKNDFRFNVPVSGWFSSDVKDLPDGSGDGAYWRELKAGTYWYDANRFNISEMPNPWGFVVKIGYIEADYTILFFTQTEGPTFRRSGNLHNDSGWQPFNAESGSNANGSWVKYADGTMICTKKMTTTINMTNTYGGSWYQVSVNLGDFPASFISPPEFLSVNNNGVPFAIPEYTNSATAWGNARILYPTKLTNYAVNLRAVAIGKWK
jgi:hypothetical protein